jgi:DNA end-binding protein Ku
MPGSNLANRKGFLKKLKRSRVLTHRLIVIDAPPLRFEPEKFEDQYETALVDLINKKRAGQPITKKDRPAGGNVVDLMEALRRSVGGAEPAKASKPSKKPRKAASGQKEMPMPIAGKKAGKEAVAKKPASKPQRKSA